MADVLRPDLCIVGAGALGNALALYARRYGAQVLLVGRDAPEPGDGPHQGLRLAALGASAARAHAIRHAGQLGLSNSEPKISLKSIQERSERLAADRAPLLAEERLHALGIETLDGAARFEGPATLLVGDTRIRARNFVLAPGAPAIVPSIPGLDQVGFLTPDSAIENTRKLTHLLVIGGTPEAFAVAQAYARLGSEVTLVPQGRALPDFDSESVAILLTALANEGVNIIDRGIVSEIVPRSQGTGAIVDLVSGEQLALDLSHILVALGREADLSVLAPDKAKLRPRPGVVGGYGLGPLGQTSNKRIRVVGAAAGMMQWQHGLRHGRAVIESLLLGAPRRAPASQPRLVMTEPSLAQIGRLSAGGEAAGGARGLFRANYAENDQAVASGTARGMAKVMTGKGGRIVAASLVGPGAADLAGILALAMEQRLSVEDLADLSVPNPSLAGVLAALGETYLEARPASPLLMRWRAFRQRLPF